MYFFHFNRYRLVFLILGARAVLLAQGNVQIVVNDKRTIEVPTGGEPVKYEFDKASWRAGRGGNICQFAVRRQWFLRPVLGEGF